MKRDIQIPNHEIGWTTLDRLSLREPEGFVAICASKTRLLRSARNDNSLYRDAGILFYKGVEP
jgi:hypothetical protein